MPDVAAAGLGSPTAHPAAQHDRKSLIRRSAALERALQGGAIVSSERADDMDTQSPPVAQIEQLIRHYLQAHPHAIDTERGIDEWWLRDLHPHPAPHDVATAIARLVAAGELASLALPDGRIAFHAPGSSDSAPSGPHCH